MARRFRLVGLVVLIWLPADRADGRVEGPAPAADTGMVVCTSLRSSAEAGAKSLADGGTAADAALTTALTQIAECAGAYASYAGVLSFLYFDSATGTVHYLNAGFDTPRGELDPASIPARASGRTALVPGFMAGVQAAHGRFGKLPFARLFDPAIHVADDGVVVDADLAAWMTLRRPVLSRLDDARSVFTKPDGRYYAEGDLFKQPALAGTLREVAAGGAGVMYSGGWARRFVEAVRRDGGKVSMEDMAAYAAKWEPPARTRFRSYDVCAAGLSSYEGVNLVEAINLVELADLKARGHYTRSAESLFWLAQILACQDLMWLTAPEAARAQGLDLSRGARTRKETSAAIWRRMHEGSWPYSLRIRQVPQAPSEHTDAVVAVDRWGNAAALTHTINANLWGETGIFVGGVSVPDPAAFQQAQVKAAGPGGRLPDTMSPTIVLLDGKPVLATSATGSGLHEKTTQVLVDVLEFGADLPAAVEGPYLLPREWKKSFTGKQRPHVRVIKDAFDGKVIEQLVALGQPVSVITPETVGEWGRWRGFLVGISIDSATRTPAGAPERKAVRAVTTKKP